MGRLVAFVALVAMSFPRAWSAAGWTFESAQPGWTLIPADVRMIARSSERDHWRVLDPRGADLAVRVLSVVPGLRKLAVVRLDEDARVYRMVLDAGPAPADHRALIATLAKPGSVSGCVVEGSDDGVRWTMLGRGNLVRLGSDERMTRGRIEYATTAARFVRLSWPRSAGLPEFSGLEIEVVEDPARWLTVPADAQAIGGGDPAGLLVRLPAALPVRALEFPEDRPFEPAGVLVWTGAGWQPFDWRRDATGDRLVLRLERKDWTARVLRVDLERPGGTTTGIGAASALIAPRWLLVHTEVAGAHRIARATDDRGTRAMPPFEPGAPLVVAVPAGEDPAETAREELLARRGDDLDRDAVLALWDVDLPEPAPRLARVVIPPRVLAEAGGDPDRLALVAQGRLLPVMRAGVLGGPSFESQRAGPVVDDASPKRAVVDVELSTPAGAVRDLELIAARRMLDLDVTVLAERPTPPGQRPRPPARATVRWSCRARGALPVCTEHLRLRRFPWTTARLVLELAARTGEPPPSLRLRAWREDPVLLFVPPGGGSVELALFDRPVATPRLAGPAVAFEAAEADIAVGSRRTPPPSFPGGFALVVVLLLVGAVVLWIVLRNLPDRR